MRFWDGSGNSWDHMQTICTSLRTENQINTTSLKSLQAGCSSWRPTNGVKALKATEHRVDRENKPGTDVNALWVEIASLLLMHQEISLEAFDDLTLVTKVVVLWSLHFSDTQLLYLSTQRHMCQQ